MEAWGTGSMCGKLDTGKVVAGTLRREGGRHTRGMGRQRPAAAYDRYRGWAIYGI